MIKKKGIKLSGKTHKEGGIKMKDTNGNNYELEDREQVLTNGVDDIKDQVICTGTGEGIGSALNELGGGISWSNKGKCEFMKKYSKVKSYLEKGDKIDFDFWYELSRKERVKFLQSISKSGKYSDYNWKDLPIEIKNKFEKFAFDGKMKKGSKVKSYLESGGYIYPPKEEWNKLTGSQKWHFLIDHAYNGVDIDNALKYKTYNWDELPNELQLEFKTHTAMGKYEDGSKISGENNEKYIIIHNDKLLDVAQFLEFGKKMPFGETMDFPEGKVYFYSDKLKDLITKYKIRATVYDNKEEFLENINSYNYFRNMNK